MSAEDYTLGYGRGSVALMALRTADTHASFFLQYLRPGMALLDVGCGPGSLTLGLAEAVHPGATIGVELTLEQTTLVAEEARSKKLDLTFENADLYDLPYPDQRFDAVFLSAVIGNLQRPTDGLREAFRVLKPGGIIGVKEFDHGGNITYPEPDFVARINELYDRLREHNGHDPKSGRKVRGYLHTAGFVDVDVRPVFEDTTPPPGSTGSPILEAIVREEWGPRFVALGWADEAEVERWIAESVSRRSGEADFSATAWVEAVGRKP